ncbi:rho guanine nucleotide exchange factor 1-like [Notothenia coriiceps]|uniref:Rho guanine nucleotide exchange factor 1-like n=1 Tax=Notothenia coriiceps TaxID=8208 RepID=A0A6I9P0S5_9TELE|nr:PREDICTED: rho guanine nucleotide exchange factor 1-like [Notothenia coriiceps]
MSIIGAEDEDFENDLNDVTEDQCTHFNNIDLLKSRPTHLLVFMQHVILQFEPAPLLCYLHADLFKSLSAKETKKQFVEFYNTFLDKGAILRVALPPNVAHELERTRADLLHEDTQRRYVQEVQSLQAAEVAKQLEDFRQKRMMGMTPSEADLSDVESHNSTNRIPREMKERSVAENLLDKMSETQHEQQIRHVTQHQQLLPLTAQSLPAGKSSLSQPSASFNRMYQQKERYHVDDISVLRGDTTWTSSSPMRDTTVDIFRRSYERYLLDISGPTRDTTVDIFQS